MYTRSFVFFLACLIAFPAMASQSPAAPSAVTVEAVPVKATELERSLEAVGSLTSNESVMISPEISGRILAVQFSEGAAVKKGDILFRLDDSIYKAQLAQAKAALSLSDANYRRAKELFRKKISSVQNVDETQARRNSDAAAVELAQAQLDKATIRAPFDGVIGLRQVSAGDYVSPGQNLVNLESIDPLKVDFKIAEIHLNALRTGQAIMATVDAFPGKFFRGEVYAIDPLIDTAGRTVSLRARLPNHDGVLRPGLFARVKLVLETRPDALMVDEQSLVPQGNAQFVYKVVDGKAVLTAVATGQRKGGKVEIVDGLRVGEMIVTAGQMKLRPNTPVKVVTAGAEADVARQRSAAGAQSR